jgi:hypothetical protein
VEKDSLLASLPAPPRNIAPITFISWFSRPWLSAAAGLAVGLSCASIGWAIVSPKAARTVSVPIRSFADQKAGRIPSHFPSSTGIWAGDESEIVLEATGEQAKEGLGALRFIRAEADVPSPSTPPEACDVFQIVDLRSLKGQIQADEDGLLQLSASFQDRRAAAGEQLRFSCRIYLYEGDPQSLKNQWPSSQRRALCESGNYIESGGGAPQASRNVTVKAVVPAQANFAVIQLLAGRINSPDRAARTDVPPITAPVLGEQYVYDVKLTLKTQASGFHVSNP